MKRSMKRLTSVTDRRRVSPIADDVRRVAAFAAEDRDLRGKDVSLVAVEGQPADFADRVVLGSSGAKVMAKVAAIVGGSGAEEFLDLSAADVRRLAGAQITSSPRG